MVQARCLNYENVFALVVQLHMSKNIYICEMRAYATTMYYMEKYKTPIMMMMIILILMIMMRYTSTIICKTRGALSAYFNRSQFCEINHKNKRHTYTYIYIVHIHAMRSFMRCISPHCDFITNPLYRISFLYASVRVLYLSAYVVNDGNVID